jgi:hypothetical protein
MTLEPHSPCPDGSKPHAQRHTREKTHTSTIRYVGRRTTGGVTVTRELPGGGTEPLPLRLDLWSHSPSGFEWGYGGSSPAQLALAILSDAVGDERALPNYQQFKFSVIGGLRRMGWVLTRDEVTDWLERERPTTRAKHGYLESSLQMDNDKQPAGKKAAAVRDVTRTVDNCLFADEWPTDAGIKDFGLESTEHYGALQYETPLRERDAPATRPGPAFTSSSGEAYCIWTKGPTTVVAVLGEASHAAAEGPQLQRPVTSGGDFSRWFDPATPARLESYPIPTREGRRGTDMLGPESSFDREEGR